VTGTSVGVGGALVLGTEPPGSRTTITRSTFENNTATGLDSSGSALAFFGGPIDLDSNLFANNVGQGALYFQNNSIGTLVNNTITGNSGDGRAGIGTNNSVTLTLINNTIAGNQCLGDCFGGTGIGQNTGGTIVVENNIIAGNLAMSGQPSNCSGPGTSNGHNLTDSPSDNTCFGGGGPNDMFETDPLLLELDDNGGPTRTRGIRAGSPALDAGGASCPRSDQRGQMRPAGSACDIGAFELQPG
jgi:hypothetical protein